MRERADTEGIDGLAVDAAVDAVVDAVDRDPAVVRAALGGIADEDGRMTWDGVDAELAEASKVVATPETRVELAAMAVSNARDAAADAPDLDTVDARVGTHENRLAALEATVDDLGTRLQDIAEQASDRDALADVALSLHDLREDASAAQWNADELADDAESFEDWLTDPETRRSEFAADLDDTAESVDALASAADRLEDNDADATTWAGAALQARVLSLVVADLHADLGDLRAWDGDYDDEADRLDALEERRVEAAERIDASATADWWDAHGDRVERFESGVRDLEPPIDWGVVQAELDAARP
ncbi:halo transducer protein [Salarchaeum sp. JOR-1]|uniref:halo transducer protein n=1 Tax=Salarchaeum sp. JOR-1 TaxID=2599399 RepID=UPI001198997B|nr:halo transducer protein [Salarchaeum sp. JOR-1]QDX41080.1 halo transducer protein [Salarchaeum sp. JOR-1]